MQKQLTVFIGRFSPFHLGHEEVLLRALTSSEVVLLVIGSADQARNIKNPFTAEERTKVIDDWYNRLLMVGRAKSLGILQIRKIQDNPYNDQEWITNIQALVNEVRESEKIPDSWPNILTGAERDASSWYLKAFGSFFKQDFVKETKVGFDFSATQLRQNYFSGGNLWEYKTPYATIDFLSKFEKTPEFTKLVEEYEFVNKYKQAWKSAPYPPTFVTVDACVIQSGHVLLVKRDAQPGRGLWALPGGFLEQNETLQTAAVRELIEETSISLSKAQLNGSIIYEKTFDHPDRSLRGRTITTCFLFKLVDTFELPKTKPQKGEGTKAEFIPIATALANPSWWYEDHLFIFKTMLGRIES